MKNTLKNRSLTKSTYQKEAIKSIIYNIQDKLHNTLENKTNQDDEKVYPNSWLLEMATWSWKTFTIWKTLELLINLRNRFNLNDFNWLNVLVLSNRIDWVEQFRDDLVHGKKDENKAPIMWNKILENIKVSTFHSKADNLEDLEENYFNADEKIEEEIFSKQNGRTKDHFMFSTYQTASLKNLWDKIDYIDMIIIDEAHNVKDGNEFKNLIDELSEKWRNGNKPYILPLTATPTNLTEELFWEPIFKYWLSEYLASDYSPNVDYRLLTRTDIKQEEIIELKNKIEKVKEIKDVKDKKEQIKEIESIFLEMISKYQNLDRLVEDLLVRLMIENENIDETIIFANNIEEADSISDEINKQFWKEISLSYHSKNDKNKALESLKNKDDKVKIIVSVNKLNESIDLPVVWNVVFWRLTDVARIFLQQFWRWLRWDWIVKFYDYVCSMKNFSWIGEIYEDYKREVEKEKGDEESEKSEKENKFRLLWWDFWSSENRVDLSILWFDINYLKESIDKLESLKDYINYFKENKDEFIDFGIVIDEDIKVINLDKLWNIKKFNLFWKLAKSWLRNLNRALWNNDEWEVSNKTNAQIILKQFFENMWYKVNYEVNNLNILKDYIIYFKENKKEFINFGIIIDEEKKVINLDELWSPKNNNLFWKLANSWLRNLNRALWNNDNWEVTNKTNAQTTLKQFFENMWYKVNYEVNEEIILNTLEDYVNYFNNNKVEFIDLGIVIDEGKKMINLNKLWNLKKFNLFWKWAKSWLRNLNTTLWNNDNWEVSNKTNAQIILKQFFESMWYKINHEVKKINILNNLEDYINYFNNNKIEFINFDIIIYEDKKVVNLDKLWSPTRCNLFWKFASSWLKNLNRALWNNDEWQVTNKTNAQIILKQFFENMWYKVNYEVNNLNILKDYIIYFKENKKEFINFGIIIDEDSKVINLDKLWNSQRNNLFWKLALSWLRNLNIALWNNDEWNVKNKTKAQIILKQFFENMWYTVITN